MSPVTRNRLVALGALLVAAAGLAFVAFGDIGENLVYYWSPSEMVAQGDKAYSATIRLGGVVQPGSIEWNQGKTELRFRVADNEKPGAPSVLVHSVEVPPQMFRERIGVVVEGTFAANQVFSSNRLMVNHSNEYRPPKEGESKEQWQKTLSETSSTSVRSP